MQATGGRSPRARRIVLGAGQNASVFCKSDIPKRAVMFEGHTNGFARRRIQELSCPVVTRRQEQIAIRTHPQAVNATAMLEWFADSLALHRSLALWPCPNENVPVNIAGGNSIR